MRRVLSLFAALVLLSAVGLAAVGLTTNSAKDDASVTEELLYGSAAGVSGLSIRSVNHYNRQLFWTTTYSPGGAERAATEFACYPEGKSEPYDGDWGLTIQTALSFGMSGYMDFEYPPPGSPVLIIADVASRTPAGETHEETLRVKDYYAFYPLSVFLDSSAFYDTQTEISEAFTAYCAIPVLEDQMITVTISKNEQGDVYSADCRVGQPDIGIDCQSLVDEDTVYFSLSSSYSYSGRVVDILPDRATGIHRVDISTDENGRRDLYPDTLQLAYPLPPEAGTITQLAETEDGSRLLLVTETNDSSLLSVIDKSTMQLLQTLPLSNPENADDHFNCLRQEPGFLVAIQDGGTFDLITEEENGTLAIQFSGNLFDHTDLELYRYDELALAYDGTRLAAASSGYRPSQENGLYESCAVTVMVCDPTGTLYAARYHNSGDRAYQESSDQSYVAGVEPIREAPVTLTFPT